MDLSLTLSPSASAMASSSMIFPSVSLTKAAPVNKAVAPLQKRNLLATRLIFPSNQVQAKLFAPAASGKGSRGTEADPPSLQSLSTLPAVAPWDDGEGGVWVNMALYLLLLHIPFSFGGLSIAASLLHQPHLDPQTKVLSLLLAASMELVAALGLLRHTANPCFKFRSLFQGNSLKERNSVKASVVGVGFLMSLVIFTSVIADYFDVGSEETSNPILKEILSSGSVSHLACIILYCFIAPLLEETVYRGFLLTSLASSMNWPSAVAISSLFFTAAHFSIDGSLQLFIIGCILGSSYCWSGNLLVPLTIHSLYNAAVLLATALS